MILKNLLTNIYYISPEIIVLLGIFISTLTGLFIKKNPVSTINNLIILTFIIGVYQILSMGEGQHLLFNNSIIVSKFTQFSKVIILLCNCVVLIIFSYFGYKSTNKLASFEMPILIALSTLGMCVFVSSNSLLTFYLGLELFSLALYILIATNKSNNKSIEASLKYFILGAISSGIFLFGASLIYGNSGTINFDEISFLYLTNYCTNFCIYSQNLVFLIGFILLIITVMFKLSLFPFHNWTPDVYEGSASSVTVLLASSAKFAALIIFLRLVFEPLIIIKEQLQQILIIVSVLSILFGNIIALIQNNIKRLIAYSAIGNMGFILMSIVSYNKNYLEYTIFYAITYIIQILTFFALIIVLKRKSNFNYKLDKLKGLSKNNAYICFSLAVVLFSMAGIPPLAGFWAKFYIFVVLIKSKTYYLAIIAFIATVIGAFYYINIIRKVYFDKEQKDMVAPKIKLNFIEILVITMGVAFNILYILFPSYMLKIISHYV